MSTIYYDIECDFTQIPNHIILNPKISGTAKAIYFYIVMRLRQNTKWEFYDFDIMEHLKEGRDSFRNAKKELLEHGYLVKVKQNIGNDGKYKGCDYAIKKEPITENPTSAKPKTDEPTSENPYTNNKKQSNNINKKQSIKETNTASGFSQNSYSEIPNNSICHEAEHTQKQKDSELKTKQEVQEFVTNFKAKEFIIDGILQTTSIFAMNEIDLITEYIMRRKEAYKSKVKNTHKALTGVLNDILQVMKEIPLAIIFEQLEGVYVNCGTKGDKSKPYQTIELSYFKHLKQKPTFTNKNDEQYTVSDYLKDNRGRIQSIDPYEAIKNAKSL